MGRAEKFLERQVERSVRAAADQDSQRPVHGVRDELKNVALRDAREVFRVELNRILRGCEESSAVERNLLEIRPASDVDDFEANAPSSSSEPAFFTATLVGGSRQGKTGMLNGLIRLFGYDLPGGGRVFADEDILPTHEKDRAGLPFPLRIEYHESFQVCTTRWTAQELQDIMVITADKAEETEDDFFDTLEFRDVEEGSFLEFISQHRIVGDGSPGEGSSGFDFTAAARSLQADGTHEVKDFILESSCSYSEIIKEAHGYLLSVVKENWFRFKNVTLRCPSHLLREMQVADARLPRILDLPGVGVVHDDNSIVEELVQRNVSIADTIIVLTGQRSFTQDVIKVLRASVFRRILDPAVIPPPTVAVTNSHMLLGLKQNEMEVWKEKVLNGDMGWYSELKAFAEENFSDRRRHRLLRELQPSLFPNDLRGFLSGEAGEQDVGVATMVGYFMRLPQEVHLSCVTDILERANAYKSTLDELWQAPMLTQKLSGRSTSRLSKVALSHRKQMFDMSLSSKLTVSAQKDIFNWEEPRSFAEQLDQIDILTERELEKLHEKFTLIRKDRTSLNFQQELSSLVKHLLLELVSDWDSSTGSIVFNRFLTSAQRLAEEVYSEWVPQLYDSKRSASPDHRAANAQIALLNALKSRIPGVISSSTISCTFTSAFRQLVWNLDVREALNVPRLRNGCFVGVRESKVWDDIVALVQKIVTKLHEHIRKTVRHDSAAVKHLISRLKSLIVQTFTECVDNFEVVASALESIALGAGSVNQNSVVLLRKQLHEFTGRLIEYLQKHKNMHKYFGEEEMKRIRATRRATERDSGPEHHVNKKQRRE